MRFTTDVSITDTWSTLTEALWNHLWGDNAKTAPVTGQGQRAADITEQFETLYARAQTESEQAGKPVAMTITITSCSRQVNYSSNSIILNFTFIRCRCCGSVLYDEEIMAGWTAEDSNLNSRCLFCERLTVPSLTISVTDHRASPPGAAGPDPTTASHPLQQNLPPVRHKPISVPYISPLVLRRELESVLGKEGDTCLTDPACPDLHPIIYWNLIYFFHRIAVPSHLPGAVLLTPSLNREAAGVIRHPGWGDADHRNVRVETSWDNAALHPPDQLPLHIQWRQRNCAVSKHKHDINTVPFKCIFLCQYFCDIWQEVRKIIFRTVQNLTFYLLEN